MLEWVWWECTLGQPPWKTIWNFLEKLKIEPPRDLSIPVLGIQPEETLIQKNTHTSMFSAALFTVTKTWKQSICLSADE